MGSKILPAVHFLTHAAPKTLAGFPASRSLSHLAAVPFAPISVRENKLVPSPLAPLQAPRQARVFSTVSRGDRHHAYLKKAAETMFGKKVWMLKDEKSNNRPALPPNLVGKAIAKGATVYVERSKTRAYKDEEYEKVGGMMCDADDPEIAKKVEVWVTTKQNDKLVAGAIHWSFHHFHKGQDEDRRAKSEEFRISAGDFELICNFDKSKPFGRGNRTVMYGAFAGNMSAMAGLFGLGVKHPDSPFAMMKGIQHYGDVGSCKQAVRELGAAIDREGLKKPFVFVTTGSGNVAQGHNEILDLLKENTWSFVDIAPDAFLIHAEAGMLNNVVYRIKLPRQQYANASEYLSRADVLCNGISWKPGDAVLLTADDCAKMSHLVICDATCDENGSVKITKPRKDNIWMLWDPKTRTEVFSDIDDPTKVPKDAVMVLVHDRLPIFVPKDAAHFFGKRFEPYFLSMIDPFTGTAIQHAVTRATLMVKGEPNPEFFPEGRIKVADAKVVSAAQPFGDLSKRRLVIVGVGGQMGRAALEFALHDGVPKENILAIDVNDKARAVAEKAGVKFMVADGSQDLFAALKSFESTDVACYAPPAKASGVAAAAAAAGANFSSTNFKNLHAAKIKSEGLALLQSHDPSVTSLPKTTLLSGAGLDPGINYLTSILAIELAKKHLAIADSVVIKGSGIPVEPGLNPLNLKSTWTWRGILDAYQRDAEQLVHNKRVIIPGHALFKPSVIGTESMFIKDAKGVPQLRHLERHPNDKASEVAPMFRDLNPKNIRIFTLRHAGNAAIFEQIVRCGLLDHKGQLSSATLSPFAALREVAQRNVAAGIGDPVWWALANNQPRSEVMKLVAEWELPMWKALVAMNFFSEVRPVVAPDPKVARYNVATPFEYFARQSEDHVRVKPGDKDVTIISTEITGIGHDGLKKRIVVQCINYANDAMTSMQQGVARTQMVASHLVAQGKFGEGVHDMSEVSAPVAKEILEHLQASGMEFTTNIETVR
jgi:saccharopine dehydrogenase-like NADP-dependent oxidoreductase